MKKQEGQILIFAIVIMFITTALVGVLVGYARIQIRSHYQAVNRAAGLDIAEAAIEMAIWKLNNQVGYTGESGTSYGGGVYDISFVDQPGGVKLITAEVFLPDATNPIAKRTVQVAASIDSDSVSFNYGAQVGDGGLTMGNESTVTGNVYSNGDIIGSNNASITGTAVAANGTALVADQVNDSPSTPTTNITFRNASASADAAQSFQVSASGPLNNVQLYLRKVGTPSNFSAIRITDSNSNNPGSTTIASGTLNASTITTSYGWVTVTFSSNPTLTAGTTYWLVLDASGTSSSNYYQWAANSGVYGTGTAKTGTYSGGPWTANTNDGYFRLYTGGLTHTIDDVNVGGDAEAHNIINSTITGNNYCQTGSGNNKACNTSRPVPGPVALPISAGQIIDWETEAAAGGTIGSYSLTNGATGSLGPVKINGDLNLNNNAILTLTGTVWVTGEINVTNGARIRLHSGYGSLSGIILAGVAGSSTAGEINLSNNAIFEGSGTAGSYILLLSQMNSSSNIAISLANNAASVILYAGTGFIHVSNNAGAKEITAYRIQMDNNSTITYDSGLANALFTSGPGASWVLRDQSWQLLQ